MNCDLKIVKISLMLRDHLITILIILNTSAKNSIEDDFQWLIYIEEEELEKRKSRII